jgi:hypothetical protein
MKEFQHIILTRFNVREHIDPPSIPSIEWHEKRFELFERYCYPAMIRQSNQDFTWLVLFDVLTAERYREKINEYARWKNFIPEYIDDIALDNVKKIIRKHLNADTPYLITTRLDNDDSVSRNFVEIIQREFTGQDLEFINITSGYILFNRRLYLASDASNPFLSLIERTGDLKTVWCREHRRVSEVGRIRQIRNNCAWIQVIHASNSRNRVKGLRIRASGIPEKYDIDTSDFGMYDHGIYYYLDRTLFSSLRIMREFMIDFMKMILRKK